MLNALAHRCVVASVLVVALGQAEPVDAQALNYIGGYPARYSPGHVVSPYRCPPRVYRPGFRRYHRGDYFASPYFDRRYSRGIAPRYSNRYWRGNRLRIVIAD